MKIALSGSTGFVGSHLHQKLSQNGHEILHLRREMSLELMMKSFAEFKPQIVIHLASCFLAEHKPYDIEKLIQSNVLFGTMILESMAQSGCQLMINAGTTWQHMNGEYHHPVCLYSATKNAFEEIINYYIDAEKISVTTLKICDTYGPNDRRGKLIAKLIESLKSEQKFELSPGEQKIDLVHAHDISRAFLATAEHMTHEQNKSRHQIYTLSSGQSHSLIEIVSLIEKLSGKRLNVSFGAKPYRKREVMEPQILDPLPPYWKAQISLQQGFQDLIHGS